MSDMLSPGSDLDHWQISRRMFENSQRFLAGGVSSNVRLSRKPWPIFFKRGEGAHLYDVDGNTYIDFLLGQGPVILGHCPAPVVEAVCRALEVGQLFAGQHEGEIRLSQRLCELIPCAELVRFGSSGSEMVQAALRLARAYTGRTRVLRFEGHYHGWFDNVLISVGPPLDRLGPRESPLPVPGSKGQDSDSFSNTVVRPWNDIELLRATFEKYGDTLAAVIMEPIMCNTHAILPQPGYLEGTRRLCDEYNVVLIFDEVITGFRVGLDGAQGRFGVTPDLAVFGKAMAAGFPISALVGRRQIMEMIGRGEVVHAGTFNTSLMVVAAAEATLAVLSDASSQHYQTMNSLGTKLMAGIREIGSKLGVPLLVEGVPTAFAVALTDRDKIRDYREYAQCCDHELYSELSTALMARGVYTTPRGIWYISTAHTSGDIDSTLGIIEDALRAVLG